MHVVDGGDEGVCLLVRKPGVRRGRPPPVSLCNTTVINRVEWMMADDRWLCVMCRRRNFFHLYIDYIKDDVFRVLWEDETLRGRAGVAPWCTERCLGSRGCSS